MRGDQGIAPNMAAHMVAPSGIMKLWRIICPKIMIQMKKGRITKVVIKHLSFWSICCLIMSCLYELEWRTVSALTRGLFWCLFPELWSNEGNKYQNNTWVSTETVRHESTYIILFLTRHNESVNDYKNDELYTSSPCLTRSVFVLLMTSQSIADDVTMTRQLWCDHVNSDM